MELPGLQGDSPPSHSLFQGLQENLTWCLKQLCPPLLHQSCCLQSCFSLVFSVLSYLSAVAAVQHPFSPSQLPYSRGAATIPDGLTLGQQWVRLRSRWLCLQWRLENFWQLLTEPSPAVLLPKPCHTNQVQALPLKAFYFKKGDKQLDLNSSFFFSFFFFPLPVRFF